MATLCPAILTGFILFLADDPRWVWDRQSIANGDWWRLWTGHLVHTNGWHSALNLAGLGLVFGLTWEVWSLRRWALVLSVLPLICSAVFWYWIPALEHYAGFSGVLHGMLVCASGWMLLQGSDRVTAVGCLTIITIKLTAEQFSHNRLLEALIDAPVLPAAHLTGALSGALLCLVGATGSAPFKENPRQT